MQGRKTREEAQWKNAWLYCDMGNKEREGGRQCEVKTIHTTNGIRRHSQQRVKEIAQNEDGAEG